MYCILENTPPPSHPNIIGILLGGMKREERKKYGNRKEKCEYKRKRKIKRIKICKRKRN
jgi:hypothetical protein